MMTRHHARRSLIVLAGVSSLLLLAQPSYARRRHRFFEPTDLEMQKPGTPRHD